MGSQELADALYASRKTVSNWIGGCTPTDGPALLASTPLPDVPIERLKTGKAPSEDGADGAAQGNRTLDLLITSATVYLSWDLISAPRET
jgi:hypothetical protein